MGRLEATKDFKKAGIRIGREFPIRQVRDAVLSVHDVLADWPEQNTTCFDLMYLESEGIVNTMLRLKREEGIVSLSVHDSLIVPDDRTELVSSVLRDEYERAVGARPDLRID